MKFLKENLTLVLGAVLPLGVVIAIVVVHQIAIAAVSIPAFDLIYSIRDYNVPNSYEIYVNNLGDRLEAKYRVRKPNEYRYETIRVYRYNFKTKDTQLIAPPPLPKDIVADGEWHELDWPVLENLKVSLVAPDGYVFQSRYDSDTPFIWNFFYSGRDRGCCRVEKSGRSIPVCNQDRSYWSCTSLGWTERLN